MLLKIKKYYILKGICFLHNFLFDVLCIQRKTSPMLDISNKLTTSHVKFEKNYELYSDETKRTILWAS